MNYKYLLLRSDSKATILKYIKSINAMNYYKLSPRNIIYKILRKLNIENIIFNNWKHEIDKYNYIILGENGFSERVTKYIKKKNKNCKLILYYWNIINNDFYLKILDDKNIDEFWTFDRQDANKYNMKYNPQFYSKDIILSENKIKYDVLFLGRAKDRKKDIFKIEQKLKDNSLTTNFKIIENEKDYIDYDNYLELVSKSKCIFDYNQDGQMGLSLRPMEALFFEKKLITNNQDIVNYDFYDKNNIFIIGKDDINNIKEFVNKPYKKIDKKIIEYYDFQNWIERFME